MFWKARDGMVNELLMWLAETVLVALAVRVIRQVVRKFFGKSS